MLKLFKAGGFWLAVNVFSIHQLDADASESHSTDMAPLWRYHYSCGVDSAILLNIEWHLKLNLYHYF